MTTGAFTTSYQGGSSSSCGTSYTITGQEPTTTGTYPIFLYMVGTGETATNASATAAVNKMASMGYVAATIAYDSGSFNTCSVIGAKAKCIFDSTKSTSAVQVLCSRAKADCTKGIVVGGFSQGAVIATQAKNYDSRVRAAWGTGDGVKYSTYDLTSCQGNGNHTLPNTNLLAVVGERDQFVGNGSLFSAGTISGVRGQLQTLTGLNCGSSATSCLNSNGSGWIIVTNSQVTDGKADHCFMRTSGDLCSASQNSLDSNWQNGTANWELAASLNWLDTFVTH